MKQPGLRKVVNTFLNGTGNETLKHTENTETCVVLAEEEHMFLPENCNNALMNQPGSRKSLQLFPECIP